MSGTEAGVRERGSGHAGQLWVSHGSGRRAATGRVALDPPPPPAPTPPPGSWQDAVRGAVTPAFALEMAPLPGGRRHLYRLRRLLCTHPVVCVCAVGGVCVCSACVPMSACARACAVWCVSVCAVVCVCSVVHGVYGVCAGVGGGVSLPALGAEGGSGTAGQ